MIVTVTLLTTALLLLIAETVRFRRHSISAEAFTQDTLIAFGGGVAIGVVFFPVGQITVEFITHGSRLTAKMLSQVDPSTLVISMVIGAFVTTGLALFEYVKRVGGQEEPTRGHQERSEAVSPNQGARQQRLSEQPRPAPPRQSLPQGSQQPMARRQRREQERMAEKQHRQRRPPS